MCVAVTVDVALAGAAGGRTLQHVLVHRQDYGDTAAATATASHQLIGWKWTQSEPSNIGLWSIHVINTRLLEFIVLHIVHILSCIR